MGNYLVNLILGLILIAGGMFSPNVAVSAVTCSAQTVSSLVIDADSNSCSGSGNQPSNGLRIVLWSYGYHGDPNYSHLKSLNWESRYGGQSGSSYQFNCSGDGYLGVYNVNLFIQGTAVCTYSITHYGGQSITYGPMEITYDGTGGSFTVSEFTVASGPFFSIGDDNADLSGLALSSGTLSPTFAASTTSYTASVANSVSSITVTPTASEANATITVNGNAVTSGSASGSIALSVGSNTITTVVTAQDGTTQQTYTTEVTRAASSDATVDELRADYGSTSVWFNPNSGDPWLNTPSYTRNVDHSVSSVTFTPTANDPTATITVDGVSVSSGSTSAPITLSGGSNLIPIVFTAQDGVTQRTYSMDFVRAGSSDADLSGLALSSGTLSPTFAASTTSYTASVANSVSSITVTPTASEANATITVNGNAVTSGSASGSIALSVGSNTITTVVTAQDGISTSSYVLTIHRADEDNLCDLSIPFDGCTMTPTGYKVLVYALGLCETAPTLPTTTSALDYSNCVLLYDKIGVDGVVVELAGVGYSTGLNADFNVPPKGTYRYAIVGLGQAISVKRQMEFPNPVKGRDGSVGRYCVTAHSDTYENWSTCSNSGFPEAGYSTDILYGFGASENQYSLGLDQNITAYAMTNDYRISTSQGETSWILGYQQFDAPLVVNESINSLDIAFIVSKGMELYDADSGSDYEVAPAPGSFSFQISVR